MSHVVTVLTPDQRHAVVDLIGSLPADQPFPDHLLADLDDPRPGFAAVVAELDRGWYAQASSVGQGAVQVAAIPEPAGAQATLATLLDSLRARAPLAVTWWTNHPDSEPIARDCGLLPGRVLLQMTIALPVDEPQLAAGQQLRTFREGLDDQAWLALNRAAFSWHPEQGGWTAETLRQRQALPWWDPSGFVLLEEHGELVGWCWTKMHLDGPDPVGEIYVIGVDPAHHGRRLGEVLTRAGLDVIARRARTAILYVDGDNTAAVRLYERIGFTTARAMRAFTATLEP